MRTPDDLGAEELDADVRGVERLRSGRYLTDGFGVRTYRQRLDSPGPIHWHEFYEVFIATAGTGTHIVNGLEMAIVLGTVAFLTPADFHQVRPDRLGLQLLDVVFSAEVLHEDVQELLLGTPSQGQIVVTGVDREALIAEFDRLWVEQDSGARGSRRISQGALERILIEFSRRKPNVPADGQHVPWGNVQRGIAYVHHHFREPLTLMKVAAQSRLSPHYFSESFHRVTGTRYNTYLRDLRLRFARSLLLAGGLPVTDICHASGFATLSHFERTFKEAYGVSPTELRRRGPSAS